MKNTILWGALFTLLCAQVQAEVTQQETQSPSPTPTVSTPGANTQPVDQTKPMEQPAQPTQQPTSQEVPPVPVQPAPVINCDYKISADTKNIDQATVITWTEHAVLQAFDFNPSSVDAQVQKLQACFTEPGWTGFNAALQKSGNIEAIKSQKLTVSSQVDGTTEVTEAKDNQWKVNLPLQVVYQNDKEKVTQLLDIKLTIGRKISGDLGIMQMIAAPRPAATPTTPIEASPANDNTSTTPTQPDASAPPANDAATQSNTAPTTTPDPSKPADAVNQSTPQTPASSTPNQSQ